MTVEDHENVYVCTVSQPRFEPDTNRIQAQFKPNVSVVCLLDIRIDIKPVTVFTEGRTALEMNVAAFNTKQAVRDPGLMIRLGDGPLYPKDAGSTFLRNVGNSSPVHTAYHTRRIECL